MTADQVFTLVSGRPALDCTLEAGPDDSPTGTAWFIPSCLFVALSSVILIIDDPKDLDEAEGGSQPPQGRLLVRVDLSHGPGRLAPRWLVASGAQVEVDPAALELELVDLALAVVFAAGLERQDLQVAGEVLELGQQVSYSHPTQRSAPSAMSGLRV